jgi:hypothetical protein
MFSLYHWESILNNGIVDQWQSQLSKKQSSVGSSPIDATISSLYFKVKYIYTYYEK